jgi:glycosyl transferase family 25
MNNYIIFIIVFIILLFILNRYNKCENFENKINKNILHNYFDDIYVITLPERKKYVENIMNELEIYPIYFDAVNKNNLDYDKLIKNNVVSYKYYKEQNNGRIACHLSHMKVLDMFLKSNKNSCLIFEDDIKQIDISKEEFNKIIKENLDKVPKDWDIIKLGKCWDSCYRSIKISDNLYRVFNPKCRHAYAVSKSGAKKILNNTIPMINNGDEMIAKLISDRYIICYAITPSIFNQNRKKLGSTLNNGSLPPPECNFIIF